MLRSIISIMFIVGTTSLATAGDIVRIQSAWDQRSDAHLHIELGRLSAGAIQPEWHSAMWILEPDESYPSLFRIKSYWKPDDYIHVRRDRLRAGPIDEDSDALWMTRAIDGTDAVRICNVTKSDACIHLEYGKLAVGVVPDHWHSARWKLLAVTATAAPSVEPAVPFDECLDWAYEKLARGSSAALARDLAREACKQIGHLTVAKLLFWHLDHDLTERTAMSHAAALATSDLGDKFAILDFVIEKLRVDLTALTSVQLAVEHAKTIPSSALSCIAREFPIYAESLTARTAMERAFQACR